MNNITSTEIHDNIFIAAGRKLGYILSKDDIASIRQQSNLQITGDQRSINSCLPKAVALAVKFYIKSCILSNKPLKRIDIKYRRYQIPKC